MNASTDSIKRESSSSGIFAHWKSDFLASLVVFLVALPLCIGIAVAVGVNPARALITGIIGGIVVGLLCGSPLQVSGPAAGLFVILADLLAKAKAKFTATSESVAGDEAMLFALMVMGAAVFLAGLLQMFAGWLGIGQWFRAVSPAVIKGMLAGIGVLILVSQVHVMLDHQALWNGEPAHGGLQYIATIPEAIGKCFSSDTTQNHHLAAATGLVTIALIVAWPLFAPKKLKIIPAPLVGVVTATIFATIAQLNVIRLNVPTNILEETTLPGAEWLGLLVDPIVLWGAVVIGIVASAETLLCATAVDQMHSGPRTKYDRELFAQGVGNALCGLVGSLPMTGVIVRSSANVNAGARTRLSTILHGIWLLIFVAALPWLLKYIPRAALGGLLVYTGIKLVNFKQVKQLWSVGRGELLIFLATVITIVSTDLLIGVAVGIGLSVIKLLLRFSRLQVNVATSPDGQQANIYLRGAATFLRLPNLAQALEKIPDHCNVQLDLHELVHIDHACLELLRDWSKQHESLGGTVVLDWKEVESRFDKPLDFKST